MDGVGNPQETDDRKRMNDDTLLYTSFPHTSHTRHSRTPVYVIPA